LETNGERFRDRTSRGPFQARSLVLALGAWLPGFQPELPLQVARQPLFWFEPVDAVFYQAERLPHYLIEFEPGHIFYGFPDLGRGLKCAIHHEGETTTAARVDRSLKPKDFEIVRDLLKQFLPGALGRLRRFSVCLYTNTPDRHFLLDRSGDDPDLWLLSACSGHGFKVRTGAGRATSGCAGGRDFARSLRGRSTDAQGWVADTAQNLKVAPSIKPRI
jgi:sarcosine oxidase